RSSVSEFPISTGRPGLRTKPGFVAGTDSSTRFGKPAKSFRHWNKTPSTQSWGVYIPRRTTGTANMISKEQLAPVRNGGTVELTVHLPPDEPAAKHSFTIDRRWVMA